MIQEDENIIRKDFTMSERQALKTAIEPRLREEAKVRMVAGVPCVDSTQGTGKAREKVASILGIGHTKMKQEDTIMAHNDPEIIGQVDSGKLSTDAAFKKVKRTEKKEANKSLKKDVPIPQGKYYDVIVVDPPWPMQKIERDVAPNQVSELDYPTMDIEEIEQLEIPSADNCHLFMWATQKFLPMAFNILNKWDFKYVCCFCWHKPGGFQPFGLPQYNWEPCLYARKGTPKFRDLKAFSLCFNAGRGKHSEKPNEFYEMVERVTGGKRLDLFNRRDIAGFDGWGNESNGKMAE